MRINAMRTVVYFHPAQCAACCNVCIFRHFSDGHSFNGMLCMFMQYCLLAMHVFFIPIKLRCDAFLSLYYVHQKASHCPINATNVARNHRWQCGIKEAVWQCR